MPFYDPFTDAKTNGEATEGNRHVELHGPLCGTAEEVAREGGAVRRGTRGKERSAEDNAVHVGSGSLLSKYRTTAKTRGFSRGYSPYSDAPEINFGENYRILYFLLGKYRILNYNPVITLEGRFVPYPQPEKPVAFVPQV